MTETNLWRWFVHCNKVGLYSPKYRMPSVIRVIKKKILSVCEREREIESVCEKEFFLTSKPICPSYQGESTIFDKGNFHT